MGLGHLPEYNRFNYACAARAFNQTWGHLVPQKNTSYRGIVRFTVTDHSHYGSQPIILQYEFPNLEGPYIHDELFMSVLDWNRNDENDLEPGAIYERILTFRNYRWYYGKITKVFNALSIIQPYEQ